MRRKLRKQRITLRFRRREQLKAGIRVALARSVAIALVTGVGIGLAAGPNAYLSKFFADHTPIVQTDLPQALTGLPVSRDLPKNAFWLWFPGSGSFLEGRICKKYSAVRSLKLHRAWGANRIQVELEPRVPLVMWNGQGFDREGVLFGTRASAWDWLPEVSFLPTVSREELGRWLGQIANIPGLWQKIKLIKQDNYGTLELTFKSGIVVIWGGTEKEGLTAKAQALLRVLDDMHVHSGGTALADLRFFDQGRIIVKPKAAR